MMAPLRRGFLLPTSPAPSACRLMRPRPACPTCSAHLKRSHRPPRGCPPFWVRRAWPQTRICTQAWFAPPLRRCRTPLAGRQLCRRAAPTPTKAQVSSAASWASSATTSRRSPRRSVAMPLAVAEVEVDASERAALARDGAPQRRSPTTPNARCLQMLMVQGVLRVNASTRT